MSASPVQNQVYCGGCVCSQCDKCRDWYLNGGIPRKPKNGPCSAYKVDFLTAAQFFAAGITRDMRPLQENHMFQCFNNRS